jgi:hypothetical protein
LSDEIGGEVIETRNAMTAVSKQYAVLMTGDVALACEAVAPDRADGEADAEPPAWVMPPTGREIAVRRTHVHGLRDGPVVTHSAVCDDRGMLGPLGVIPPRPAVLMRMAMWMLTGTASRAAVTDAGATRVDGRSR